MERASSPPARPPRRRQALLVVLVVLGVVALAAVTRGGGVLRGYDIGANSSMFPALEPGDWFLVGPGPIERGAVVVLESPNPSQREPLVKRIVAVAGDLVELRRGRLVLNGAEVPGGDAGRGSVWGPDPSGQWQESACSLRAEVLDGTAYRIACAPDGSCGEDMPPQRVPPGAVFVLGDHRDHSADSRYFGAIPERSIRGRVKWVYFSHGPAGVRWERIGKRVQ